MIQKPVHQSVRNILVFGWLDFQDDGNDSWTFQLIGAQFIWLKKKIQHFKKEEVGSGARYYSEVELGEEKKVIVRFYNREALDGLDQNMVRLEDNWIGFSGTGNRK